MFYNRLMCESKGGGKDMLDVSGMTVEQFEDLVNKPKLSYGTFYVVYEGEQIELSQWVNKYCVGILAGVEYEDYLEWCLEIIERDGLSGLNVEDLLKVSLRSYIEDRLDLQYDEVEFRRVYEVLLSVKESLLRFKILRCNRSLPLPVVFRMIKDREESCNL